MKFTPQQIKFFHSIDGVNYSLDFFREYKPLLCISSFNIRNVIDFVPNYKHVLVQN